MLSVIILNYKTDDLFLECVESVKKSSYQNLDIIGIHNDAYINNNLCKGHLNIFKDKNVGPAVALNHGIRRAKGNYVVFLAADTKVSPYYFEHALNCLEENSDVGAVAGRVYEIPPVTDYKFNWDFANRCWFFLFPNQPYPIDGVHLYPSIDSIGEYLGWHGFLIQRHLGQKLDKGQFDEPCDIFSTKGTALIVRKSILDKIGGHDEDYFMFLEDTDLCMKILLQGYKIRYVPECILYHHIDAHKGKERQKMAAYYGCRNYIMTLIKNLSLRNLCIILPIHILIWLGYGILRGNLWFYLKAIGWNILHIRQTLRKRRVIQRTRKVSDKAFMLKRPTFEMFWRRLK